MIWLFPGCLIKMYYSMALFSVIRSLKLYGIKKEQMHATYQRIGQFNCKEFMYHTFCHLCLLAYGIL